MSPEPQIRMPDEFASTMQQLSAEAQQVLRSDSGEKTDGLKKQLGQLTQEMRTLNARVQGLESNVSGRLEKMAAAGPSTELQDQVRKMDEYLEAARNTESVNQRLFDSLHEELIKYRDNFLHESLQKPFIRDLVILFDDLSSLLKQIKSVGGKGGGHASASQWAENLENSLHALVEVLHRLEVNQIEAKEKVDRALHKVVTYEPADFAEEDGQIVMRVKRGFLWRDQVLRPEEVVAKRFS
ncbi:MAG: nucleotide exchange factor GrpE [Chthoniobacterales bacterium]